MAPRAPTPPKRGGRCGVKALPWRLRCCGAQLLRGQLQGAAPRHRSRAGAWLQAPPQWLLHLAGCCPWPADGRVAEWGCLRGEGWQPAPAQPQHRVRGCLLVAACWWLLVGRLQGSLPHANMWLHRPGGCHSLTLRREGHSAAIHHDGWYCSSGHRCQVLLHQLCRHRHANGGGWGRRDGGRAAKAGGLAQGAERLLS